MYTALEKGKTFDFVDVEFVSDITAVLGRVVVRVRVDGEKSVRFAEKRIRRFQICRDRRRRCILSAYCGCRKKAL